MIEAVQRVRERLLRATTALDRAGAPYAVAGSNAAAALIARVDESAVRNTQEVNILLRRADLGRAREALCSAGFHYCPEILADFLDGDGTRPRDRVRIIFAAEKMRADDLEAAPDVVEAQRDEHFNVLSLAALVRMMLTAFRLNDQVDLQDMIGVGLIDATWPARFAPPLDSRLQELLDDPNG